MMPINSIVQVDRITAADMRIARYYAGRLSAMLWGLIKKWGS
jgi:hypothetical protein